MAFPFNVYLLAFLSAWLTTLAALPVWRAWCRRTGLVDDPGHRKIHTTPIPLAGGLAVMTGLIIPLAMGSLVLNLNLAHWVFIINGTAGTMRAEELLSYGLERRSLQLAAILAGAVGMAVLGWLDDKHELRPGPKFCGQLLIAGLVAAAGVRITLFVPSAWFSYAVTVLWILTVTNAFNFMDNMNGLCAGLGAIGAWIFACAAAAQGQYLVTLLGLVACGALLGFLPYNFPRASAFLGDAGSHLVGYLMAVAAILPHFYTSEHPKIIAVLSPLLVLGVTLADLAWVVIYRWSQGRPFYVGDTNHLSHQLARRGFSKTRAVLVLWLLSAILGGITFLL